MVQVGLSPRSFGTCEECPPRLITYVILIYIIFAGHVGLTHACRTHSLPDAVLQRRNFAYFQLSGKFDTVQFWFGEVGFLIKIS